MFLISVAYSEAPIFHTHIGLLEVELLLFLPRLV